MHWTSPLQLQVGVIHREALQFLVLLVVHDMMFLGHRRLQLYNPRIAWTTGQGQCVPGGTPASPNV